MPLTVKESAELMYEIMRPAFKEVYEEGKSRGKDTFLEWTPLGLTITEKDSVN